MFLVDQVMLLCGVLLLLGIASSKFSSRFGVPVLVLFLVLGMLAGSEGVGGIHFEDYSLAHAIGTVALALILFDGGLSTPMSSIQMAWKPALPLATVGVFITAIITGWAAHVVLKISLLEGMLLGSIVGSTDAAAVFAVLRSGGVSLKQKLSATLEIESGSNDPMAIFLTVGIIELLANRVELGLGMLQLFLTQMVYGAVIGLAFGYAAVAVVNRIRLDAAGLYPVLVTAFGLFTFGAAALVGGSGFLAVYLAGIILGNNRLVFKRGIFLFHDALAWLAQIVMFVVLGLLSFPSRLLEVAWQGLLIAVILIFVARPAAVLLSVFPFRFNLREMAFLSWVGLKGAVPITLATFPLLQGLPEAPLIFDVVFFVVLFSALVQGWSLPAIAKMLHLDVPRESTPPVTLELSSLQHVDGDIVDYLVAPQSRAAGRLVKDLALPDGAVIAIIARGQKIIPPQGNSRIEVGDHVILVLTPGTVALVNKVFSADRATQSPISMKLEFPLRAHIRVKDLEEFYGIQLDAPAAQTLGQAIEDRLGKDQVKVGASYEFRDLIFYVRQVGDDGHIVTVGMVIR